MKIIRKITSSQSGVSLIEVMISLALTSIIALSIMQTYVTQHENYLVQDDVTFMQQNARASIDELTRQIRMAGHHLPLGLPPIIAANTNPDTITITYHGNNCETFLSSKMPNTSAELKCGSDVSCFNADQWVYIYDPDSAAGEWFQISHVQTGSNHIQHRYDPKNLSREYDQDALLLSLNRVKFFVDAATDKLMIQIGGDPPVPYADNVVDLQFRYRLSNGMVVDEPVLISNVCEVIMSVTVESDRAIYDAHGDQPPDDIPIRTYTSSVSLRNIS